jgi:hypothetical protein
MPVLLTSPVSEPTSSRSFPCEASLFVQRRSPAAGWHDLTAEDGTVALDLSKVV